MNSSFKGHIHVKKQKKKKKGGGCLETWPTDWWKFPLTPHKHTPTLTCVYTSVLHIKLRYLLKQSSVLNCRSLRTFFFFSPFKTKLQSLGSFPLLIQYWPTFSITENRQNRSLALKQFPENKKDPFCLPPQSSNATLGLWRDSMRWPVIRAFFFFS